MGRKGLFRGEMEIGDLPTECGRQAVSGSSASSASLSGQHHLYPDLQYNLDRIVRTCHVVFQGLEYKDGGEMIIEMRVPFEGPNSPL